MTGVLEWSQRSGTRVIITRSEHVHHQSGTYASVHPLNNVRPIACSLRRTISSGVLRSDCRDCAVAMCELDRGYRAAGAPSGAANPVTNSAPSLRFSSYHLDETCQVGPYEWRHASVTRSPIGRNWTPPGPAVRGRPQFRLVAGTSTDRMACPVGSVRDQSALTVRNIHCSLPLFNLHWMA
jgi:hypothetical protein